MDGGESQLEDMIRERSRCSYDLVSCSGEHDPTPDPHQKLWLTRFDILRIQEMVRDLRNLCPTNEVSNLERKIQEILSKATSK